MTTDLRLMVRREEAVLVRVLGLVARRGFESVKVVAVAQDGRYHIDLSVEGARSVDVLVKQVARLNEVELIEVTRRSAEEV